MNRAAFLEHWSTRIDLEPGETIIGRAPSCDVHLQDEGLSRRHVRFVLDGAGASVEDLGSTNGTTLNGRPLAGLRPIDDGDVLQFGGGVYIFRLQAQQEQRPEPPLSDLARSFMSQSFEDRRIHPRIPTNIPVRFVAKEHDEHRGVAWDLSPGGMFIACGAVDGWVPGTRGFLITLLPDGGPALPASGVIRHVISSATMQGHPPGLGVRFEKLADQTRRWLELTVEASR